MPTRLDLRTDLRLRLEDTGAAPLWDDATLNDALDAAIRSYAARFPKQIATTLAVTAGVTSIPVPAPVIDPDRIARVRDDKGQTVPRHPDAGAGAPPPGLGPPFAQAWRWWNNTLLLERPAPTAGTWTIEHLGPRVVPTDDVTALDVFPGDEEIVVLLAAAVALRRRAVEDAKRGLRPGPLPSLAALAQTSADRLLAARHRRPTGGWLT